MPPNSISRRNFLKTGGLALASSVLPLAAPAFLRHTSARRLTPADLPTHPNLLIILTDQERTPQHWPAGWNYAANLPNRQRLLDQGISFERHFCNTTMCSPSRATLFTGMYPAQHGVDHTLTYGKPQSQYETILPRDIFSLARILTTAGYHVSLKGKWHLSKDENGNAPDTDDVLAYGFRDWEFTTAGEASDVDSFGGGCVAKDDEIAAQAVQFLQNYSDSAPFALIVSLANPHDVLAYPNEFADESCANSYANTADFNQGISLPVSCSADDLSTKPSVQAASKELYRTFLGALTPQERTNYVNFYAHLHRVVDERIGLVLDALENTGCWNDTIIVRSCDHGEMGMSHDGLRQKMFNAYEETMRVPLIISNPTLFPTPQTTQALASLVDLVPTVAALANVPNRQNYYLLGHDLSPVLSTPAASVQDEVLFTFDDEHAGTGMSIPGIQACPHHIRCVREANWKFARYFDPDGLMTTEYEMYKLDTDLDELNNLADPENPDYETYAYDRGRLTQKLADLEASLLNPLHRLYLPTITR